MTPDEWSAIRLSFLFAVTAATVCLGPAILLGYWLARGERTAVKWAVEVVSNLPLVLPPIVTGYLLLCLLAPTGPVGSLLMQTLGVKIVFTPLAAILAACIVSFPLMVRTVRLAFQSVDTQLESASRTLGASPQRTFLTITLPLALPGLVAGWILAFARSLGEFGATIMVAGSIVGRTQTIPLAIFSMSSVPGGLERSWHLVVVAILVSCIALAAGECLERRAAARSRC